MRSFSHFEKKEPFLEKALRDLRFKKVKKYIAKNSKVLDLGCGFDARLLEEIRGRISCGTGIDVSVKKTPDEDKIKLLKGDLNQPLPFSENNFDFVISLANLEHLNNWEESLGEICRVLRPGGILLLTTPSTFSKPVLEFLSFRLRLISQQEILDHKKYFNKKILTESCKRVGFSYCRHSYFQFFMNNLLIAKK